MRTLDELHRLIYDLRPSVLDDLGLWSAIQWYADRQLKPRGVAVQCEFTDVERRLPPLMETALFRAVQEAVSNIAKHADAEHVLIQCGFEGDVLTIEIEDDGSGFEPAAVKRPNDEGHGWGLLGHHRARRGARRHRRHRHRPGPGRTHRHHRSRSPGGRACLRSVCSLPTTTPSSAKA